jgi:hypothetical protein
VKSWVKEVDAAISHFLILLLLRAERSGFPPELERGPAGRPGNKETG